MARRTIDELQRGAAETEAWLDSLDPDEVPAKDARALRRIGEAVMRRAAVEAEIAQAVADAREQGHSWGMIALALGTSRQAARQRYGQPVGHD